MWRVIISEKNKKKMRLEIEKKLDPCIVLSPNGQHYMGLMKEEMQGKIIDELWKLIEPYFKVDEDYTKIKMSLNVDTLIENAVSFKDGYPQYGQREYLKIW